MNKNQQSELSQIRRDIDDGASVVWFIADRLRDDGGDDGFPMSVILYGLAENLYKAVSRLEKFGEVTP